MPSAGARAGQVGRRNARVHVGRRWRMGVLGDVLRGRRQGLPLGRRLDQRRGGGQQHAGEDGEHRHAPYSSDPFHALRCKPHCASGSGAAPRGAPRDVRAGSRSSNWITGWPSGTERVSLNTTEIPHAGSQVEPEQEEAEEPREGEEGRAQAPSRARAQGQGQVLRTQPVWRSQPSQGALKVHHQQEGSSRHLDARPGPA